MKLDTILKGSQKAKKNKNSENRLFTGLVFSAGMLAGSLISTVVTLLLAPQSGEKTRRQIRRKGRDLREHASDTIEDSVAQVRDKASQVTTGIQEQSAALQQRGQDVIGKGKERLDAVVSAGKAAVNAS